MFGSIGDWYLSSSRNIHKCLMLMSLGLFHLKMGRRGEEILPIFETPLYKKWHFRDPPIQQNGIFKTPLYNKFSNFDPPIQKWPEFDPLYKKWPKFYPPPIQKRQKFDPQYKKWPKVGQKLVQSWSKFWSKVDSNSDSIWLLIHL